ncbi:hypothetical protein K438DRAFT_1967413 [Mycena galopus ATCC 62051]|nr:hypothetical protein K438DRAFT_1967413 [Mycena galopus ATCC 62051]
MMKKSKTGNAKPKEMFPPYDAANVPDIMPFPTLAKVVSTKGGDTAVPVLNEWQRSWIHDIALRDVAPATLLDKKKVLRVYQRVKDEVFESKAFQHSTQEGDGAEEKLLPSMIATWKATQKDKKKNKGKNDKNAADDDSDGEEDQGARGRLCAATLKLDG